MALPFLCIFQTTMDVVWNYLQRMFVIGIRLSEKKISFDEVCQVKDRVRYLKGQPQYIVAQAFYQVVMSSAVSPRFSDHQKGFDMLFIC
jgi:hypothetical protein